MAHSPPSILGSDLPPNEGEVSVPRSGSGAMMSSNNPISLLRESLSTGSQSPASVLHATAETARVLAAADGVAIAVRTKGVVICRARSGEIAPELGTQLSDDSGISGECLRTGTVLICQDAATDPRVDPDVCRVLGIQSIAVVPLNGPSGVAGILEAFSTRAGAFGDEQLDVLRGLAEVAEAAYEQECIARGDSKASSWSRLRGKPTPPVAEVAAKETADGESHSSGPVESAPIFHSKRLYWIVAAATAVLLLVSGVVWLSWRDPPPEVAASEALPQPVRPVEKSTSAPPKPAPSKPGAGVVNHSTASTSKTGDVLKNAAAIQRVGTTDAAPANGSRAENTPASEVGSASPKPAAESAPNEPPPTVEIATSNEPDLISGMGAGTGTMPALGARVSQGITQGALVHQVQPAYPSQAWAQRIAGSVVLDATIGKDGSVRKLDLISGAPLLATAAKEAVRQWKYNPALLNGAPIEVQKRITVVFKLP